MLMKPRYTSALWALWLVCVSFFIHCCLKLVQLYKFIMNSKIHLRKIILNTYFKAILHHFGFNLLSGATILDKSILSNILAWFPIKKAT